MNELEKKLKNFDKQITDLNTKLSNPRSTTDKRLEAIEERMSQLMLPQYHFAEMVEIRYETQEAPDPILLRKYKKLPKDQKKILKEGGTVTIDGITIKGIDDIPLTKMVTSINYVVQEDKKAGVINKYYGKHLLVTDLGDEDTVKILNVYRDQEFVERFFRDSKDTQHYSVRPIYHWTDQKIRVHVWICYLGLTLSKLATYVLKREVNYKITCPELLERLDNVQECLVIMKVNGEQLKPVKTLNELEGKDLEVWTAAEKMVTYIHDHPFTQKSN